MTRQPAKDNQFLQLEVFWKRRGESYTIRREHKRCTGERKKLHFFVHSDNFITVKTRFLPQSFSQTWLFHPLNICDSIIHIKDTKVPDKRKWGFEQSRLIVVHVILYILWWICTQHCESSYNLKHTQGGIQLI